MKKLKVETSYEVYEISELEGEYKRLYDMAYEASEKAYAPYSKFYVGAALLLGNGEILSANNQENVAYPSGLCAERTALFYAGANYPGEVVKVLAIAAEHKGIHEDFITPCGACRQVMLETETRQGQPMRVLLCGAKEAFLFSSAESLLPLCFSKFGDER